MEKIKLNYLIDILMAIFFFLTLISGLILFFVLAGQKRGGGHYTFLNIAKYNWINIHNLSGLVFIILSLIHLTLHWKWIYEMTKKYF